MAGRRWSDSQIPDGALERALGRNYGTRNSTRSGDYYAHKGKTGMWLIDYKSDGRLNLPGDISEHAIKGIIDALAIARREGSEE